MPFPRILLAIPLIAAGAFLPAVGRAPAKAPAGTVGMEHEDFTTTQIEIHVGESVTLVNDSRYLHVIGPGRDGAVYLEDGNPFTHRILSEVDDVFTTPPFEEPGVYWITCRTHPTMTLRVTVVE
jgi:plastocyanin